MADEKKVEDENIKRVDVKVKKLCSDSKTPTRGSAYAAGSDFYSIEDCEIGPLETKLIGTGIAVEIPPGKVLQFWDRSGMGSKGIHRFAGVIDSDYRGEVKAALYNSTQKPYRILKGDKIVQGIILDYYRPVFEEVEQLSESARGQGGFGSTGR